jgi:hypothetical protein
MRFSRLSRVAASWVSSSCGWPSSNRLEDVVQLERPPLDLLLTLGLLVEAPYLHRKLSTMSR